MTSGKAEYDRLFVAVVTPYEQGGTDRVDLDGLRELLERFLTPTNIEAGMGIVINPEAGEVFYLSRQEKLANIRLAVEVAAGRVPVFAGVIQATTAGTVQDALDAVEAGVDGLFVMPPMGAMDVSSSWDSDSYPEVMSDFLNAISAAVGEDVPMLVHPTSRPTAQFGVGIPAEATVSICNAVPAIVGWKMTYSYDGYRVISRSLGRVNRPILRLGAAAHYFHESLATGQFDGTVTGSFNYALEPMLGHIAAWRAGDAERALKIWDNGLAELQEYMYSEYSRLHVRYKVATWLRGFVTNPFMRPPFPKPHRAEVEKLRNLLRDGGMATIADDKISPVVDSLRR